MTESPTMPEVLYLEAVEQDEVPHFKVWSMDSESCGTGVDPESAVTFYAACIHSEISALQAHLEKIEAGGFVLIPSN